MPSRLSLPSPNLSLVPKPSLQPAEFEQIWVGKDMRYGRAMALPACAFSILASVPPLSGAP